MAIDLIERFGSARNPEITEELWDGFLREVGLALNRVLSEAQSIEVTRSELIQTTLFRVNELIAPAFERALVYQTGGFLEAGIDPDTEVAFTEGEQTLLIAEDKRDLFRPTPFLGLTRTTTTADLAIARTLSFDAATGALVVDIVAVIGAEGQFDDVLVVAMAGSVQAQHLFLTEAAAARDAADDDRVAAEDAAQDAAEDAIATAADREQTRVDRIATELARTAAEEARDEAQTFDPDGYYGKAASDARYATAEQGEKADTALQAEVLEGIGSWALLFEDEITTPVASITRTGIPQDKNDLAIFFDELHHNHNNTTNYTLELSADGATWVGPINLPPTLYRATGSIEIANYSRDGGKVAFFGLFQLNSDTYSLVPSSTVNSCVVRMDGITAYRIKPANGSLSAGAVRSYLR